MTFTTQIFIFVFLPIIIFVYFAIEQKFKKFKNTFLLLSSIFFYAWFGLQYAILVFVLTIVNYYIGLKVYNKKFFIIFSTIINISLLCVFKYTGFFIENLNTLLLSVGVNFQLIKLSIPQPIGISFIVFQLLSYLIDVFRGTVEPQRNFIKFALFVFWFPKLITGPITRYFDMENQLYSRTITNASFALGIKRFIIGFSKKLLLADSLNKVVTYVFDNINNYNTLSVWIAMICYTLQIYYDFSGYTDMAIGIGKMFGFDLPENFDYPYISKSIKEFWRRWHITLSTWFRDYLYIPLGGNRKGLFKTYRNLFIVFLATGFWHGANWTFILWGLFHGLFLVLERTKIGSYLKKLPDIIQHIYAMLIVSVGWAIFRSSSIKDAFLFIKCLFIPNFSGWQNIVIFLNKELILYIILSIILCIPWVKTKNLFLNKNLYRKDILMPFITNILNIGYLLLFIVSISYMSSSSFSPFIYFKF
jgi:alginate O-acetyltransferase complex protein AlgI